jgi:hypothetical protein
MESFSLLVIGRVNPVPTSYPLSFPVPFFMVPYKLSALSGVVTVHVALILKKRGLLISSGVFGTKS